MAGPRLNDRRQTNGITITVDGRPLACRAGETVATALLAAGIRKLRASPKYGEPRGVFCMMGVCQECAIRIDDQVQPACLVPVYPGQRVELGPTA